MITRLFFIVLIFLSAVVESTIMPFPFVFLLCSMYFIFFEGLFPLAIIFFGGLLLDTFSLNQIGHTSIFLFSSFLLILALENIFTYKNSLIMAVTLILGVFLYQYFSNYPFIPSMFIIMIFTVFLYVIFERKMLDKKEATYPEERKI